METRDNPSLSSLLVRKTFIYFFLYPFSRQNRRFSVTSETNNPFQRLFPILLKILKRFWTWFNGRSILIWLCGIPQGCLLYRKTGIIRPFLSSLHLPYICNGFFPIYKMRKSPVLINFSPYITLKNIFYDLR